MGVYHFMGLGRSVGAVTAAISYLAARYQRYNDADRQFFAQSGEVGQTGKRGELQALILFTTAELRQGTVPCHEYLLNQAGQDRGQTCSQAKMAPTLKKLLPSELRLLAGGRNAVKLYWCDVAHDDPLLTFERVVKVLQATKRPGELDKEVWVNLTGGTNIINTDLELATALTGSPARIYYTLSRNDRCVRHTVPLSDLGTERDRFWLDLPVIYLNFSPVHYTILNELAEVAKPLSLTDLFSRVQQKEWSALEDVDCNLFKRSYLVPLQAQQLIVWQTDQRLPDDRPDNRVGIGPRWPTFRRYYDALSESEATVTLEQLQESWFCTDEIPLTS